MASRNLKLPDFMLLDGEEERFLSPEQVLAEVASLTLKLRETRRASGGEVDAWMEQMAAHHPETGPYFGIHRGLPAIFELEHAADLRRLVKTPAGQIVLLLLCRDFYYLWRRLGKETRAEISGEVLEYGYAVGAIFARLALLPGLDRVMISVHDHGATWTDAHPLVEPDL